MSEQEFDRLESELKEAVIAFDWAGAEDVCEDLVEQISLAKEPIPLLRSKRILHLLRQKRLFGQMLQIADAVMTSGQTDPVIRRQYAQGLIDNGLLSAAELVVEEISGDPDIAETEKLECLGLSGRIYKQRYASVDQSNEALGREYINRALDYYLDGYRLNSRSIWHAINAVALSARAAKDGSLQRGAPDPKTLASEVLEVLAAREAERDGGLRSWETATMLEARIALGEFEGAAATALDYSRSADVDAFELSSTVRQLTEIWGLSEAEPPGDSILPILASALLEREGGSVTFVPKAVRPSAMRLEGVFGDNVPRTVKWYREGLTRTGGIARIEQMDGRGIGTAALVAADEFFPGANGFVLMTNAHVVSLAPADSGLPPHHVKANFLGAGVEYAIDEVVWSSPQTELDVTLLRVKGIPDATPLPVSENSIEIKQPAPRVYIIGHPSGRDLEFSLNDNRLLAANETLLHYRAPTEPGSSGSPVFDQFGWEMIALHHGGGDHVPRLDGSPGTYQANEGISIRAIKKAVSEG